MEVAVNYFKGLAFDGFLLQQRMVVRSGLSRSKEEVCDLAPILEYETLELYETRPGGHRHSAPATPSLPCEGKGGPQHRYGTKNPPWTVATDG